MQTKENSKKSEGMFAQLCRCLSQANLMGNQSACLQIETFFVCLFGVKEILFTKPEM